MLSFVPWSLNLWIRKEKESALAPPGLLMKLQVKYKFLYQKLKCREIIMLKWSFQKLPVKQNGEVLPYSFLAFVRYSIYISAAVHMQFSSGFSFNWWSTSRRCRGGTCWRCSMYGYFKIPLSSVCCYLWKQIWHLFSRSFGLLSLQIKLWQI